MQEKPKALLRPGMDRYSIMMGLGNTGISMLDVGKENRIFTKFTHKKIIQVFTSKIKIPRSHLKIWKEVYIITEEQSFQGDP